MTILNIRRTRLSKETKNPPKYQRDDDIRITLNIKITRFSKMTTKRIKFSRNIITEKEEVAHKRIEH